MAKVKEIVIFLILIVILVGIFGFVVGSVSNLIFPPSQANYGDKIVKDIGSDGILIATLDNCAKVSEKDIIKEFGKMVDNADSYYIEGTMDIVNNEDIYTYDVKVSYAKKDNYKVELVNTVNRFLKFGCDKTISTAAIVSLLVR